MNVCVGFWKRFFCFPKQKERNDKNEKNIKQKHLDSKLG